MGGGWRRDASSIYYSRRRKKRTSPSDGIWVIRWRWRWRWSGSLHSPLDWGRATGGMARKDSEDGGARIRRTRVERFIGKTLLWWATVEISMSRAHSPTAPPFVLAPESYIVWLHYLPERVHVGKYIVKYYCTGSPKELHNLNCHIYCNYTGTIISSNMLAPRVRSDLN